MFLEHHVCLFFFGSGGIVEKQKDKSELEMSSESTT